MKELISTIGFLVIGIVICSSQNYSIEIEGSIILGNSNAAQPQAGTMRWTGADFEAFNGLEWVSMTGGRTAPGEDPDGNLYPTVRIGDQVWFTKNLRTSKYADGSPIHFVTDNAQWANQTSGAYCWHNNNNIYDEERGKLYNWYAVNDGRGLCPTGWRVGTKSDYETLISYLGGTDIAGGKMKQEGTITWQDPNNGATNASGFTAVGYSSRSAGGNFSSFFSALGPIWTGTASIGNEAFYVNLANQIISVKIFDAPVGGGYAVRCIK